MLNEKKFKSTPKGFSNPTGLPNSDQQQQEWISENKNWWESNPMRYDFSEKLEIEEGSKAFYDEIDRRFFKSAIEFIPSKVLPFDSIIPFDTLNEKDVLEIGVGNGSHAQLLAQHAKSFCGIDLTEYGAKSTQQRFLVNKINGNIFQMNAEELQFADNSFDFVWSWGVIHHSANTEAIIKQIQRVLKPGGTTIVMVYHRGFYYYLSAILIWLSKGYFLKGKSLHQAIQDKTDGAIGRYYKPAEFSKLFQQSGFDVELTSIMGQKSDILPIPGSRLKWSILNMIPNSIGRFFTNTLGWGLMLVLTARKK